MRIEVREASREDAEAVAGLIARLKSLNEELDPHFKVVDDLDEVARRYVERSIEARDVVVLVAEDRDNGEIVGVLRAEIVDRVFYEPRLKLVITDFYVKPSYRGRRVGSLLLRRLEEKARAGGVSMITAVYPAGNIIAEEFYKSRGFVKLQEEVYKRV